MFDFDRHIVGERWEAFLHPLNYAHAMCGAVEKIRVAECNVLSPGFYLLGDVGQHDVRRDYAEPPVVNGNHRTVAAEMLAAAGRLRISGNAIGLSIKHRGVTRERRQAGSIRCLKP